MGVFIMKNTIEFRNISKYFFGVKAVDNISFTADSGKVYALIGENGAGKSTLLKMLNGDYIPTKGQLLINGETKLFNSPKEAIDEGISVIYQERQILMELTVAENVFLGHWPRNNRRLIDYHKMNEKTDMIIKSFGLNINPKEQVKNLSIAHQQMVEIMKANNRDIKVIAFDEPTASLTDTEIKVLFNIIRKLKAEGKIIFYVSHRMNEIEEIAEKIIVFKDGKLVNLVDRETVTNQDLIRMMVGRNLGDIFNELERNKDFGDIVLEVQGLTTDYVTDVSFKLRRGEILGFSGLVGAGRTEVMRAIFGLDNIKKGKVILNNKEILIKTPPNAIENGIALCPEDRKQQGIIPNLSVGANISVSILNKLTNKINYINEKKEKRIIEDNIKKFNIKTPNQDKKIVELSGGNQQKAILARWLETNPQVLILDEPTKGIDIGAKSEFYKLICECARLGKGVIVISSELPEIVGLSDKIIVMKDGRISGEIPRNEVTEEKIMQYAMFGRESA
jgi:L-arabinose transport system ATP-binding protein